MRRPWPKAALVAAVVAVLLALWWARERRPGDVLLITVDALRPDHLGLYGYDRSTSGELERWLADGAVFERAYATASLTSPSVTSLLSGRLPQEHGVRLHWQLVPDEIALLPDLLPDRYQTAAFVSNMVLTDEAIGFGRRFDHYDDSVDERESRRRFFERNAARTTDAALIWLERFRDPDRPLFLWVHYIDPHGPYDPPPEATESFDHGTARLIDSERVRPYMRLPGVDDGLVYIDRYDAEVAYTDREIGRLLRGYGEAADWKAALTIFSADHGESMMEHEAWFRHSYQVYEELVRVPLVVRGPGVRQGRYDALASTIDIAPTVLGFAGVEVPPELTGRDLRKPLGPAAERSVYVESGSRSSLHWRAELRGRHKWMAAFDRQSGEIVETRLYDLAADPGELRPGSWSPDTQPPPTLLDLCRADPDPGGIPRQARRGLRLEGPKVSDRADEAALEALRALGYID